MRIYTVPAGSEVSVVEKLNDFTQKFDSFEWNLLCSERRFLNAMDEAFDTNDLTKLRSAAKEILTK